MPAFQIFAKLGPEEGFILAVIAGLLWWLYRLGEKGILSRQAVPGLMTTLGIFGTFLGVVIALAPLSFSSPDKMTESIEALLAGMTTAFLTSLLGLGSAIVAKWRWSLAAATEKAPSPEHKDIVDRLEAIKNAIAGDGDSSMVTQMQKLRDENRDGFKKLDGLADTIKDALVKNLKNLIKDIREIVGEQLTTSLEELIDKIEEALIKQFGETFVQFNDAVQALKKWQEDYREQVEQLTEAFAETAKGIKKIKNDCAKIPEAMDELAPMISGLNEQIAAFAEMKQQAIEAFPAIKENLDQIGEDLRKSAAGFGGLQETIQSIVQNAQDEVQKSSENMRAEMEKSQKDAASKVESVVTATSKALATRIDEEIERLTKEWGDNMVAIAKKCDEALRAVNAINQNQ